MSLLCLSNTNSQPSNSFQNDFTNTFEVETGSEIALHSIAFNRMPLYDISEKFFFVHHGEQLDESGTPSDQTREFPLSRPSIIPLNNGGYTTTELVTEVQRALRANDRHPNYQNKWTATANMGGTSNDIFQGITIECDQLAPPVKDTHGDVTTRVVPSGIVGLEDFRSAIIDYTDITSGTVKRTDTDGILEPYFRTKYPTNLCNGEFIINFSGMYDLTDYIDPKNKIGISRDYNIDSTRINDSFFDVHICIYSEDDTDYKKGDVLLHQYVNKSSGWIEEEIIYYRNSTLNYGPDPDSAFKLLDEPMNLIDKPDGHTTIDYNAFRFVFGNEQTMIFIGDETTTPPTWELLAKTTVKPVSFSNYAVYPKVYMPASTKDISVTPATGIEPACKIVHQNQVSTYQIPIMYNWTEAAIKDADFNVWALASSNDIWDEVYKLVSAPSTQPHLNYDNTIITGHVDRSEFYFAPNANMNRILGFKDSVTQAVVKAASSAISTFTPTELDIPSYTANTGQSITFVRCPTLTQKSLNGETKSLSSIICDVPRYLLNGQTYGRLYYAPPEKTYLKLHNKEKFNINRLNLELTNANEQLVNDLVGQTSIILHIRKSQN